MINPVARAKQVLNEYNIGAVPTLSLKEIAKNEKIIYRFDKFPDDKWLAGMLVFKGDKRKIIVNTLFDNVGRENFTFAHELGHYFLDHKPTLNNEGQEIIRCATSDIRNDTRPQETEANQFAVELLMPENHFRLAMMGAQIDFALIGSLSTSFIVSKLACSNRIVNLTNSNCIIIRTNGLNIEGSAVSRSARYYYTQSKTVPLNTVAYSIIENKRWYDNFTPCDPSKWLCRKIQDKEVYECTHLSADKSRAMIIIKW